MRRRVACPPRVSCCGGHRWLAVLLPLLLAMLLAQLEVQAHAYSVLTSGSQQDRLTPARSCVQCNLAAALLSGVGMAVVQPLARIDALIARLLPAAGPHRAVFQPLGFRSRAPPASP